MQKLIMKKKPFSAPEIINAVYSTSWSITRENFISYVIRLARTTEINAIVIDIKDYSGYMAYNTNVPKVKEYNAEYIKITNLEALIERFHQEGIYVIARIAVFQDPVLANARPDLAVHSKSKLSYLGSEFDSLTLWLDNLKLAWIDPSSKEAWDYNIAIAKDAASRGFDELNFDYIRFPSDGKLSDMKFSSWDGITPRHLVLKDFFQYLRQELPDIKISVDLFGLVCNNYDDLGIGQIIEDAFENFDYISPMVYPSHYASGFLGYSNPAQYPYQVVKDSIQKAFRRITIFNETFNKNAKIRPWLQDFDMGANYDAYMVKSEIQAVQNALGDEYNGFMLWNPRNIYTEGALELSN
ncbi:MAG: putative glycoside hydrolase [Candidatus Nealsonbacteria bacterium]